MKKLLLISLLLTVLYATACTASDKESFVSEQPESSDTSSLKVNITMGDRIITATMENNATARDFLSRLPIEATLNDFNSTTEKIFYPNPALTITNVTYGCAPKSGDITIYAPWGNVAIFCKSWSHSQDLIKIGHIDGNGIEALCVAGDVQVTFEKRKSNER